MGYIWIKTGLLMDNDKESTLFKAGPDAGWTEKQP